MTPPIPFGASAKKGIFSHFGILDPVSKESQGLEKPLQINVGLPESGYSQISEGGRSWITFSYALDNDLEAANGRLVLEDRFEIAGKNNKLITFERAVRSTSDEAFWNSAAQRLNSLKPFHAKHSTVKKFYREVVLPLKQAPLTLVKAPVEESQESPSLVDRSAKDIPRDFIPVMLELNSPLPSREVRIEKRDSVNLLKRSLLASPLSQLHMALDWQIANYTVQATRPDLIGAFFGGSIGFQLGRAYGAGFGFRSAWAARLSSTAFGLALEVPAFELSTRLVQRWQGSEASMEGFSENLPGHYMSFGAFRAASLVSHSPLVAFATLHGMNQWHRSRENASGSASYMEGVVDDFVMFSHMTFASHLSEVALVRSLAGHHASPTLLFETQMATYRQIQKWNSQAEVYVRKGVEGAEGVVKFLPQVAYLHPEKDLWVLGPIVPERGQYPDVATLENGPHALKIYKVGNEYFISSDRSQASASHSPVEFFDAAEKSWKKLGDNLLTLTHGLELRVDGKAIYQLRYRDAAGRTKATTLIEPPPKVLHSTPLNFLPLFGEAPVLATELSTENPGMARERVSHFFVKDYGELSAFTRVGLDKHVLRSERANSVNEDAFGLFLDAQGNPTFLLCDGMGGYESGEIASKQGVEHMTQTLRTQAGASLADAALAAHVQIQASGKGQTVMGALRLFPDGSVEHASAGDSRLWIIRNVAPGEYRIYEPRLPDTRAALLLQRGVIQSVIAMNVHPWSNVRSGLGGDASLNVVHEITENGNHQLFHQRRLQINQGTFKEPRWEEFKLQEGDEFLLLSDGAANGFDPNKLLRMRHERHTVSSNLNALDQFTQRSMKLFEWIFSQKIPAGQKVAIPQGYLYEGHFAEASGKIYEQGPSENEWSLVGYASPDNATAVWFRFNPQKKLPLSPPQKAEPVSPKLPPPASTAPAKAVDSHNPEGEPLARLRVLWNDQVHLLDMAASGLVIGKSHQGELFKNNPSWVEGEHFRLEASQNGKDWVYRLTVLSDTGLWIENLHMNKKRLFKILKKGESLEIPPDSYEIKFRTSEHEWLQSLFFIFPVITEAPPKL